MNSEMGVSINVDAKQFKETAEKLYNMHGMTPEELIEEMVIMLRTDLENALREG